MYSFFLGALKGHFYRNHWVFTVGVYTGKETHTNEMYDQVFLPSHLQNATTAKRPQQPNICAHQCNCQLFLAVINKVDFILLLEGNVELKIALRFKVCF